jgi:exonuclease SbcC
MRAFGSYSQEQIIDFRDLKDKTFFLIHGPTGAGKTTIFDAICFALYGDSSGDERTSKQMRSDFAPPTVQTEVTFDFQLGQDFYRITRIPEQEKQGKKAASTLVRAQATLWKRTHCQNDQEEGTVLATKASDATTKIEELLGFASSQFRQVVLLPQGKFRQLLMSSSKDKEQILEALFKTEIYKRIETALKDAAANIGNELEDKMLRANVLLEQASVASTADLAAKREQTELDFREAKAKVMLLRGRQEIAQKELNEALRVSQLLKESKDSQLALSSLHSQVGEYQLKAETLDNAQKAQALFESEKVLNSFREENKTIETKVSQAKASLDLAEEKQKQSDARYQTELAKEEQRKQSEQKLLVLNELAGKVNELASAQKSLLLVNEQFQQENQKLSRLQSSLKATEEDLLHKQQLLSPAQKIAIEIDLRRKSKSEFEEVIRKFKQLNAIADSLANAQAICNQSKLTYSDAEKQFDQKKDQLDQLESNWMHGQASVLASNLVDNQPCPVCGSCQHPHKAELQETQTPDDLLKSKREEIKEVGKFFDSLRAEVQEQEKRVIGIEANHKALVESLGNWATMSETQIKEQSIQATQCLLESEEAQRLADELAQEIAALNKQAQEIKQHLQEAELSTRKLKEERDKTQAIVSEREQAFPEHLRNQDALRKSKQEAQLLRDTLYQAFTSAQESLAQAKQSLSSSQATLKACLDEEVRVKQRLAERQEEFNSRLKESGFANESEYKTGKLETEQIQLLESAIKSFEANLQATRLRCERAALAAKDLVKPNLEQFGQVAQEASELLEFALKEEATKEQELKQIDKLLDELSKTSNATKELESKYEVIGKIAEVATGHNKHGITFQRFVLGALLDDVLIATTERLKIMSRGRYALQRALSRTDRRTTGGLDLEIYDNYTGTTRAAATLSGGESFLASLCLALGLADVVQSYAGGIYLETMLIDEGFGSLDPESLDLALRALVDLQDGRRLIGIISHVPELKEKIEARLEIIPGTVGSQARFSVA